MRFIENSFLPQKEGPKFRVGDKVMFGDGQAVVKMAYTWAPPYTYDIAGDGFKGRVLEESLKPVKSAPLSKEQGETEEKKEPADMAKVLALLDKVVPKDKFPLIKESILEATKPSVAGPEKYAPVKYWDLGEGVERYPKLGYSLQEIDIYGRLKVCEWVTLGLTPIGINWVYKWGEIK